MKCETISECFESACSLCVYSILSPLHFLEAGKMECRLHTVLTTPEY